MKFYRCWILWRKPLVLVVPGLFSLAFLGANLPKLQKLNNFRANFTSSDFSNNPRLPDSISRLWYSGRASYSPLVRFSSCGILHPIFVYECPSHWSHRIQSRQCIPRHSRIWQDPCRIRLRKWNTWSLPSHIDIGRIRHHNICRPIGAVYNV